MSELEPKDTVYLRISRACNRVESAQATVFISLADADAMMANPPRGFSANSLLRALDAATNVSVKCCDHQVRLDRQLGAGVIEIVIGDACERITEIAARRTLPDGSGA